MRSPTLPARAYEIVREVLGPDRQVPTIGMMAANTTFTPSYLSYIFNGRRAGTIEALAAIAGYLGCTIDALYNALRSRSYMKVKRRPRKILGPTAKKVRGRKLRAGAVKAKGKRSLENIIRYRS